MLTKPLDTENKTKINFQALFPYLGLLVVLLYFGIGTKGQIFSGRCLNSIITDGLYIFVGSVGYVFLISQGNFDFSVGNTMAVSCAVSCLAAHINVNLALPAGVITGAIIGLITAFVIVKVGILSFIGTLAMMFVLAGISLIVLNGGVLSAPLEMIDWYTLPFRLTVIILFAIVGYFGFEYTAYGKYCRVIGSNMETARQSGINVVLMRMLPFVIMGAVAGLLGFVSLIRTGSASNTTGSSLFLNVLNAILLGGLPLSGGTTCKFRSVAIGTLTVTFLSIGMTLMKYGDLVQQLIQGLVFLIAVGLSFDRRNVKIIK